MRNVKIGTVSFLLEDSRHTTDLNLRRGCEYIRRAAADGCDIICLPEMFRTVNVPGGDFDGETIDGECARTLSDTARECGINVVATYYVTEGSRTYNQSTVFDRQGNIAGYYRKVQLTMSEVRGGITAGNELPVIPLDFGRVAVMVCMDIYFPEIPRIYAHKGAEILFWPTVMHGPTQSGLASQLSAMAITNSMIIAESNMAVHPPYAPYSGRYRPGTGRIFDSAGEIVAATGRREGIACASFDLDEERLTSNVVLIREPDHYRQDMESITRLDLYAREYAMLVRGHRLNPEYESATTELPKEPKE